MDFYAIVIVLFILAWACCIGGKLAVSATLDKQRSALSAMCSWCAEPMSPHAKLCLHCGREKPLPAAPQFVLPNNPRFNIEPSDN